MSIVVLHMRRTVLWMVISVSEDRIVSIFFWRNNFQNFANHRRNLGGHNLRVVLCVPRLLTLEELLCTMHKIVLQISRHCLSVHIFYLRN
jgi:hypothetical protein